MLIDLVFLTHRPVVVLLILNVITLVTTPVAMVTCCHGYHPLGCGAADLVCSIWLNVIYKGSLVTSDVVIRSVLTVKLCDGLIARLSCVTLDEF